jgi:hypothetical protein
MNEFIEFCISSTGFNFLPKPLWTTLEDLSETLEVVLKEKN